MQDNRTQLVVVVGLAVVVLLAMLGGIALAMRQISVPDFMIAMGTTALGALASILVRMPSEAPQRVQVVNAEQDPAPVDETPARRKS